MAASAKCCRQPSNRGSWRRENPYGCESAHCRAASSASACVAPTRTTERSGLTLPALVIHATNLLNQKVWLPAWGDNSNDTMPVDRGRSVFVGLEFFLNRE